MEDDTRAAIADEFGGLVVDRLDRLVGLVVDESRRQNLIAAATVPHIWHRHVLDSLQLLSFAAETRGDWLDVGTGAGFPGMVIACARAEPMTLVEPRQKRARFLAEACNSLNLAHVEVVQRRVENVTAKNVAVISARAVAGLPELLRQCVHCADRDTLWILPRGRSGAEELERARQTWQGVFHVKQSRTDAEASIVLATRVRRRR